MGTLEIRLMGTMTLSRDGKPLDTVPSRSVRNLLGYLVVNRASVHARDHLAGIFWGDHDDRQARHCLNTALWRLHRLLAPPGFRHAPYLRVDPHCIGFDPESDVRIDLDEFTRYIKWAEQIGPGQAERQAELYSRAVDNHSGQLLPGCYDDWCLIEREQIQNRYLQALSHLLSYHSRRGESPKAIDYARRILVQDPLREEVHRDLIDVLLAANQPAAALRQYEECEQILAQELAIQPMEETQARLRTVLSRTQMSTATEFAHPDMQIEWNAARSERSDLVKSLSRLRQQMVSFDKSYADLREAISEVDVVASRVQRSSAHDGLNVAYRQEIEHLRMATQELDSFLCRRQPKAPEANHRAVKQSM